MLLICQICDIRNENRGIKKFRSFKFGGLIKVGLHTKVVQTKGQLSTIVATFYQFTESHW